MIHEAKSMELVNRGEMALSTWKLLPKNIGAPFPMLFSSRSLLLIPRKLSRSARALRSAYYSNSRERQHLRVSLLPPLTKNFTLRYCGRTEGNRLPSWGRYHPAFRVSTDSLTPCISAIMWYGRLMPGHRTMFSYTTSSGTPLIMTKRSSTSASTGLPRPS